MTPHRVAARRASARWEYMFFIDIEGPPAATPQVAAALAELKRPRAVPQDPRLVSRRDPMSSRTAACNILDPCELSPSYVRSIAPYQPGKPISELARELGLDEASIVKLASNENPLGIWPAGARRDRGGARRDRPLSRRQRLRAEAGALGRYGVTRATDRARQRLERRARAGRRAPSSRPGRAAVYSQHASRCIRSPPRRAARAGSWCRRRTTATTSRRWRTAIDDGDPRGLHRQPEQPDRHLRAAGRARGVPRATCRRSVLVVLDEAYNEYLPAELRADSLQWLERHPNLVVTRTFSKAYGLAGLRVGYALAHPPVADVMNRVRQPFNVNSLALAAATAALDDMEFVARSYAVNRAGHATARARAAARLGLEYIPSYGNFVTSRSRAYGKAGRPQSTSELLRQRRDRAPGRRLRPARAPARDRRHCPRRTSGSSGAGGGIGTRGRLGRVHARTECLCPSQSQARHHRRRPDRRLVRARAEAGRPSAARWSASAATRPNLELALERGVDR